MSPHDVVALAVALSRRADDGGDALAPFARLLGEHERARVRSVVQRIRDGKRVSVVACVPNVSPPDADELVLADPPPSEEGGGVSAPQRPFSASALNAYAECERKWFYRYVCNAVEDPGSVAATYGTAVHLALQRLHERYDHPSEVAESELREALDREIVAAFESMRGDFPTAVEYDLHLRRARRTAERYVEWLVAEARRSPFTVIACEAQAQLELDGHRFIGYIDRIDRDDASGVLRVVDYKTGTIAADFAEYRDKVRAFREFQLPFYYWSQVAAGHEVGTLVLLPLKDPARPIRPVVVPVAQFRPELEASRRRMDALCTEIESGAKTFFEPAQDPSACAFCSYVRACTRRPADEPEKFGR